MSLLFNVFFAWKCTSTHHKLALDALRHMRGNDVEAWCNAFLAHIEPYLEGSKAPDNQFKDFRNHVLHVRENYWGGAVESAQAWYKKTVESLRGEQWKEAAYNAGVLSHYVTDPLQPFHTAQSEAEAPVHRPCEWSIACSYDRLRDVLENELGGYPPLELPKGADWLATLIRQGADAANPHYEPLIDHYDVAKGVKDPPAGLDQEMIDRLAPLIGRAAVSFARVLERAIDEAGVQPPKTQVSLLGTLAALTVPLFWVTKRMANAKERATVEAMYRELVETGRVRQTLPEDEQTVRRLHAEEVLKTPLSTLDGQTPRAAGTKHGQGAMPRTAKPEAPPPKEKAPPKEQPAAATNRVDAAAPAPKPPVKPSPAGGAAAARYYLERDMPVEDAPSIGPKTAERLGRIGVKTVDDLLAQNPEIAAQRLNVAHITPETVRAWQAQARLVMRVPNLRGHDAQILVACGITEAEQLATARAKELLGHAEQFLQTSEGERVLRSGQKPDVAEIGRWIVAARGARALPTAARQ